MPDNTFADYDPSEYTTNEQTGLFNLKNTQLQNSAAPMQSQNFCQVTKMPREVSLRVELLVNGAVVRTLRYSHKTDKRGLISLTGSMKKLFKKGDRIQVRVVSDFGRPYYIYPGCNLTVERLRQFE